MNAYNYLHALDRASRIELQARKLKAMADLYRAMGICADSMRIQARNMLHHAANIRGRAAGRI